MKIRSLLLVAVLLTLASAAYALKIPVQWTTALDAKDLRAGEAGQVVVTAHIDPDWHVYSMTPRKGEGPKPTKIELVPGPALAPAGPAVQPEPHRELDKGFNIEIEIYSGAVSFGLPVKVAPGITGAQKATVKVYFQTCKGGACLPPRTVELPVTFTVAPGAARPDHAKPPAAAPKQPAGYTAPPKAAAAVQQQQQPPAKQDLLGFLGLALAAGFLALLTPCVFPMVPITVSYFAKQQESNPGMGVRGPAAYCAGIICTFTAVGVLASVFFGAAAVSNFATNPWVNLVLAVLFVVMAINLFGGFEIILPSWLIDKTQSGTRKSGLTGPFLMGMTFTLTSFTCTVAFVGTLLATASRGNVLQPALGMLVFSSAFASPFFLLALFPGWLSKMPKAGSWLTTVKGFMGFLEIAAALKFLSNADLVWQLGYIPRPVFLAVWTGLFVVAGLYLLGWLRLPHDGEGGIGPIRRGIGLATMGIGFYFLAAINGASLGQAEGFMPPDPYPGKAAAHGSLVAERVKWLEHYDEAVAQARAEHKPIFIDFTGLTCTNCRLMERQVFTDAGVQDAFQKFVTVRLYTDKESAESNRYRDLQLKQFGQTTLPLYVVLSPTEEKLGEYSYNTDVKAFLDFLDSSHTKAEVLARN